MKKLTIIFFSFLFGCLVHGQTLSGVVSDAKTKELLVGATILIGESGTTSNFEGYYTIDVPKGSIRIRVSYIGFTTIEKEIQIAAGDNSMDFQLETSASLLNAAVVTGSKYEQRLAESVVSIDVIRPKLLQNTNTTSVDQIFSKIPGVQIIDGQPNIRGGSGWAYNSGNRVMVLLDDIPALQPDAGRALWADMPVENISQLEVIKGAGSALYGSAAMNGVINIRTMYPTATPETQVSIFHTRFDRYGDNRKNWFDHTPQSTGFTATHKRKEGKLDIVAGIYYLKQDSSQTYRELDFNEKFRASTNLRYRITDRLVVGINTILNFGKNSSYFLWRNGSTGALRPFDGTVTRSVNQRYIVDPFINYYDKHDNKHRFQGRIFYNNNDNNLDQSNQSLFTYGEYQFQRRISTFNLVLTSGFLASHTDSNSDLFANGDLGHTNAATYVQLDKGFGERMQVSGGLRYEYHHQTNSQINHTTLTLPAGEASEGKLVGRLGMNYQAAEGTFFRMSYGQGYRFPILIERFLSTAFGGFTVLPNPALQSETGFTFEIGMKQGFKIGSFEGYLDLATFVQQYDNMMEFVFVSDPLIGFKSLNIGDTDIRGVEMGIASNAKVFGVPINIYGGYSYINPTYRNFDQTIQESSSVDANVLKYRTRHSFTMDVQSDMGAFMCGASILGASHMLAVDGILETFIPDLRAYRQLNNKGFRVVDARIGYTYDFAKLSIHFKNLLNAEYTLRPGIIEPPRNFALRLDFTL